MATATVSESDLQTLSDLRRDYIDSVQLSDVDRFGGG
jgi:hypothetical protein